MTETKSNKMALGTVQFGQAYGISNNRGQLPEFEVAEILLRARSAEICLFDTAPAYGSSQVLLGKYLPEDRVKITTKVDAISEDTITRNSVKKCSEKFFQTLEQLQRVSVYGLLLHNAGDLLKPGSDHLYQWLIELKGKKCVEKIGVSAYTPSELQSIVRRYMIDLAQIPVNIFDQRFLEKNFATDLKNEYQLEIHARSVFLQGLLLLDPKQLPVSLDYIKPNLAKFRKLITEELFSPLEITVSFVENLTEIDRVVYGVTKVEEFDQLLMLKRRPIPNGLIDKLKVEDESLVDPRQW